MRMPFGKFRGTSLENLPDEYLFWLHGLSDLREPLKTFVDLAYQRRCEPPRQYAAPISFEDAQARELIEAGYRALAKKYHPDKGGDVRRMQEINATMERLRGR
jgi:hypothetical protein